MDTVFELSGGEEDGEAEWKAWKKALRAADMPHERYIENAKPSFRESKGGPPPPSCLSQPPTVHGEGNRDRLGVKRTLMKVKSSSSSSNALCG